MSSELEEIRQKKMHDMMNKARSGHASGEKDQDAPVTVNDAEFEGFVNKYPFVVVDCWAPWCGPCRMLAPTIESMAKEYSGKVVFGKLNTDENIGTASKYRIMSIPTLLFFKNGKLVDRSIGALPKPMLESQVKKHIE